MSPSRIPKPGSVEVGPEKVEGETRIRRSVLSPDKLVTQPWEGIDTVYDVLMYAARTHGTKQSYGYRDLVDTHEEEKEVKKVVGGKEVTEKKTWKYFQLSDYKYLSFQQVKEAAVEVAGALLELGIQKTDVVNVYSATRYVSCYVVFRSRARVSPRRGHRRVRQQRHGESAVSRPAASGWRNERPLVRYTLCHRQYVTRRSV